MKVGILAGGLGTRLSEESQIRPKPMVEVGGRPILWHIMKGYAAYGYKEFVVALGYKAEVIIDYFMNYRYHASSVSVCLGTGEVKVHGADHEDWTVHLLNTGVDTQTGGRVKRIAEFIGNETFMLTYGDGVGNVDLGRLLEFHRQHGKLATVTAVHPPGRFGGLSFDGHLACHFEEKPRLGEGWINGGFFVLEPGIASYIESDSIPWEWEPMQGLVRDQQLGAYQHGGFWQCMDTLRDVKLLNDLWQKGAPWKTWAGEPQ